MSYLKDLRTPFARVAFQLKIRGAQARLARETDEVPRLLRAALNETAQHEVSPEEQGWIEKIEALREKLNASVSPVSIMDYGAGAPSHRLTHAEMEKGRVVTRTVGDVCRGNSRSYFWSLLLFKLIRKFTPSFCAELGTCLGISAAFQAAALKLNGAGTLVTLEGAETLAALAKEHFQALRLDNVSVVTGRFQDTLQGVLAARPAINYAFIDGHHDEHATVMYFEQLLPFLSERALLVFDDISWSQGMRRAWNTIRTDARVTLPVDLKQMGICVIDKR